MIQLKNNFPYYKNNFPYYTSRFLSQSSILSPSWKVVILTLKVKVLIFLGMGEVQGEINEYHLHNIGILIRVLDQASTYVFHHAQ